jgi:hypothetical protein
MEGKVEKRSREKKGRKLNLIISTALNKLHGA